MLSVAQMTLLAILLVAGVLAVTGWLRTDLVALLVLFALAVTGLVTPKQAFAGFSSPAVITLGGLFILTAAMNSAGIIHWIAERIERLTGDSQGKMILVFMLVGAALSLVVNTAAAGAVMLPAVVSLCKRHRIPVAKILMPMGFGVIVGGTATIFTTANIIMSGLLEARGHGGLDLFDFLPTGGVLVVVTTLYMLSAGRKLLPEQSPAERGGLKQTDLAGVYAMEKRLWEVEVEADSELVGKNLAEARLDFPVLAIWRQNRAMFNPGGAADLQAHDILLVSAARSRLEELTQQGLHVGRGRHMDERRIPVVMVETVISPRSKAVGKTLADLRFQTRHGLTAVALWRGGESHRYEVGSMRLQAGDALLLVGPVERVLELSENPDYLVVDTPRYPPMSQGRAVLTLFIAVAVLAAAGIGLVSMSLAAFSGALALVLLRALTAEAAYAAIDWSVLFLIAGMFPLASAMESTGITGVIAEAFGHHFASGSALIPVAALYLLTVLFTQIVGGQVSALLTGPIALSIAAELGFDLVATAVLVGIAASNCFLTSIAHPVNLLVAGPAGYRGKDFLRVGAGLQILVFAAAMLMARFYWGL